MALIALVDMRNNNKAHKKKGDVICIKKEGEPWGELETKYFVRIKIEDPELEAQLTADDNEHPIRPNPYMTVEQEVEGGPWTIINKSTRRFDFTRFREETAAEFGTTLEELADHVTDTPIIWKKDTAAGKDNPFSMDDLITDDSDRNLCETDILDDNGEPILSEDGLPLISE